MLKAGITGGIGAGKSTVSSVFAILGIPVFDADDAARYLIDHDATLKNSIQKLFGNDIYINEKLDRPKVSAIVFKQPEKLQQLNELVHPATIIYGKKWMEKQQAPYAIKEAAIFFESGSNKGVDVMIGVYAPKELRITRAMEHLKLTYAQVLERMAQQMDENEKMSLCDYVIKNDETTPIIPQVLALHRTLLQKAY